MRWLRPLRIAALGLTAGFAPVDRAYAEAPLVLTYQGVLLDKNNQPVNGTQNVVVRLWDESLSTDPTHRIYEEVHLDVPVSDGAFEVRVGEGRLPSRAFTTDLFDNPSLWIEVEIGSETLAPRKRIGFVARALRADNARNADSLGILGASDLQERVTGTCLPGSALRVIPADGTSPTCEVDSDTRYTAGFGLILTGNQLSLNANTMQLQVGGSCAVGQAIRVVNQNGTVACETDNDTDTTYVAGSGLTLTGSLLAIASGGVATANLAPNAASLAKLATDAVDSRVIQLDTLTADDLGPSSVGAAEIRPGAVGTEELDDALLVDSTLVLDGTLTGEDFAPASLSDLEFSNEAGGSGGDLNGGTLTSILVPPGGGIAIAYASGTFAFNGTGPNDTAKCRLTTLPGSTSPGFASVEASSPVIGGAGYVYRPFLLTGGRTVTGDQLLQFSIECFASYEDLGHTGTILFLDETISVLFLPTRY